MEDVSGELKMAGPVLRKVALSVTAKGFDIGIVVVVLVLMVVDIVVVVVAADRVGGVIRDVTSMVRMIKRLAFFIRHLYGVQCEPRQISMDHRTYHRAISHL